MKKWILGMLGAALVLSPANSQIQQQTTAELLEHYRELSQKAEHGSPEDKTRLARAILSSEVPNAHALAKVTTLLHAASRDGDATANLILSDHYRTGTGVITDAEVADQFRQRVVERKHKNGETLRIVEADCSDLDKPPFLQIITQPGVSADDQYKAAWCKLKDSTNAAPDEGSVKLLQSAAEAGHDQARIALAMLHETGRGVKKSGKLAAQWYRRVAASDSEPALRDEASYRYILLALAKEADAPNWPKLADELLRLGRNGRVEAFLVAGQLAFASDLPNLQSERNLARAESILAAGYNVGRLLVAVCHDKGLGTPVNLEKAAEYYEAAAKSGSRIAHARLGDMWALGQLGAIDNTKAILHYRKAVEAGHRASEPNLRLLERTTKVDKLQ